MTWRSRERDERGTVGIVIGLVLCFVVVPLAALVIDIGSQRVARTDAQGVADLVALDMARQLGRTPQAPPGAAEARDRVLARMCSGADDLAGCRASLLDPGGSDVRVALQLGYLDPTGAVPFSSRQDRGCAALRSGTTPSPSTSQGREALGYDTGLLPYFSFADQSTTLARPNAVLVTVATTTRFVFGAARGPVCRSAIATPYSMVPGVVVPPTPSGSPTTTATPPRVTAPIACYDVGSFALAARAGDATLVNALVGRLAGQSPIIGDTTKVTALGYSGLATAQVDLARLSAALGLGGTRDLATASVTATRLFDAVRQSLVGTASASDLETLRVLAEQASSTATVATGSLLRIGAEEPVGAHASALDLVTGALVLLDGRSFADVTVGASLPGLTTTQLTLRLTQGPRRFCGAVGDASVTATQTNLTEQVGLSFRSSLLPGTSVSLGAVSGLLGSRGSAQVALPATTKVDVSVAPVSTTLEAVRCGPPAGATIATTGGVATVTVDTTLSGVRVEEQYLGVLGSLLTNVLELEAHVRMTLTIGPSGRVSTAIDVPPRAFDTPYVVGGATSVSAPAVSTDGVRVRLLGGLLSLTTSDQSRLADRVAQGLLGPMFDLTNANSFVNTTLRSALGGLGIQLGGADLSLSGITCPPTTPSVTPTPTPTPAPTPTATPTHTPSPTVAPRLRG